VMDREKNMIGGISCGLLMILYIGVFVLACVRRVNSKMNFWQITFIFFLTIGSLLRLVNWCIKLLQSQQVDIGNNLTQRAIFYLFVSSEPFILGAYLDILFLWAYVYDTIQYEFHGDTELKFRILLISVVGFIIAVFLSLWIVDLIKFPVEKDKSIDMANVCQQYLITFTGACYILAGISFAYKGLRFYYFFKTSDTTMPLYYEYAKKQQEEQILPRIKYITVICALCFGIRGVLSILNAIYTVPSNLYWFMDLPFWGFLEVLPLTLMLFILQKPKTNNIQPLLMHA